MYSGCMVVISRNEFETMEFLVHRREQTARDAIAAYADQAAGDRKAAEEDNMSLLTGDPTPHTKPAIPPHHRPSVGTASAHGSRRGSPRPWVGSPGGLGAIKDDDAADDDVKDAPMGAAGAAYMGGEEHRDPGLENTARKYDEFRTYLQAVRAARSCRKPGPSALDDSETVASAPSAGPGARAAGDLDRDAVEQHARVAKHAALAALGVDDVSALSSSASLAHSVWSYGTVKKKRSEARSTERLSQ